MGNHGDCVWTSELHGLFLGNQDNEYDGCFQPTGAEMRLVLVAAISVFLAGCCSTFDEVSKALLLCANFCIQLVLLMYFWDIQIILEVVVVGQQQPFVTVMIVEVIS